MNDLADGMIDLTANPTYINWMYDGSAQDYPLPPLLYTLVVAGRIDMLLLLGVS